MNNYKDLEFKPSDLPQIISRQVQDISELEKKIKNVKELANKAKTSAEDAKKEVTFFGGRKEAIEQLQTSGKSIANAVIENAEAHQLSFNFQKDLADISKFLFFLGASNITQNRLVVKELELKMQGASQEQISELAKKELHNVIRQLKEQEDLLVKINQAKKNIRSLNENVIEQAEIDKMHDKELKSQAIKDRQHDKELESQAIKDKQHDKELESQAIKDKQHDKELKSQAIKDKQHDQQIHELTKQINQLNKDSALVGNSKIYRNDAQQITDIKAQIKRIEKKNVFLMIGLFITIITFSITIYLKLPI